MAFLPLLPKQQRTTTRYEPERGDAVFRPKPPARPAPAQPHCWLLRREAQERALVMAEEAAASPLHCYGDHCGEEGKPLWRLAHRGVVITTDAELNEMVDQAFDGVLQRIHAGTEAQRKVAHAINELQREEAECRQCNIVELWGRSLTELILFKELTGGKIMMWNEYLRQLHVYQELFHLVQEEKRARIKLLGRFVSCKFPDPCRHLLWDMEVLEESSIPLEPEVNLLCLFTSIVMSQQDMLHAPLLAQWKWELKLIKKRECLARSAFRVYRRVRNEEQKKYDTLIAYHRFCVKRHASVRGAQVLDRTNKDAVDTEVRAGGSNRQRLSLRRRLPCLGSPIMDYYIYLHIIGTFRVESKLRRRIRMFEFMDVCYLAHLHEAAGRRVVAADEEKARQCVLLTMEEWARSNVNHQATEFLRLDLSSDTLYRRAQEAKTIVCARDTCRELFYSAEAALTALCVFEHDRRGAFLLLEVQLRTELRQLLCRMDHVMEVCVVNRRMHTRERRLLERDETSRRVTVVKNAEDEMFCPSVAHAWIAEEHAAFLKTVPDARERHAAEQCLAEQQILRDAIEALWQHEHNSLFAQKLCVPLEAHEPLDMRQVFVSDLLEFVGDAAVLGVFA